MNRGVLFFAVFLLALSVVSAFDMSQFDSLDDLPPEVREKLPEGFTMDDLPANFSQEDLLALAREHNISLEELFDTNDSNVLLTLCTAFISSFDFQGAEFPNYVPFTFDVFNIYTFDNESIAFVRVADKYIVEVNCSSHLNATYEVFIKDLDTLVRIAEADYKLDAYRHEKKLGNVKVKGIRFGAMVKTALLNAAIGVMAIFG